MQKIVTREQHRKNKRNKSKILLKITNKHLFVIISSSQRILILIFSTHLQINLADKFLSQSCYYVDIHQKFVNFVFLFFEQANKYQYLFSKIDIIFDAVTKRIIFYLNFE